LTCGNLPGVIFDMPHFETEWRHLILSTHRNWLHGSQRGFRSRRHRIHSSGDYKNPPPEGEHEGLRDYHRQCFRGRRVEIPLDLRQELCHVIALKLIRLGCPVLTVSVGRKHAHALAEVPADLSVVRQIVGKCKTARSTRIRQLLPGTIWGEGGKWKLVPTRAIRDRVFGYIADDQERDARTWTHLEGPPPAPKGFR
jgi:REP element-mobilizing transposase RayT